MDLLILRERLSLRLWRGMLRRKLLCLLCLLLWAWLLRRVLMNLTLSLLLLRHLSPPLLFLDSLSL